MKIGPRYKICKRFGNSVFEKCQTQKFALSEQRHSQRARRKRPKALSDYGRQLMEKQRARFTYGITERQLARYVRELSARRGADPVAGLLERLEMRLDNVVFRMGLALTRRAARQMVSHGHITVNGRKVTIPSFAVSEGDTVAVRENSRSKPLFASVEERAKEFSLPSWIAFNAASLSGAIQARPTSDLIEPQFDPTVVLEFYSR